MMALRSQAACIPWAVGPVNARQLRCACRAASSQSGDARQPAAAERRQVLQLLGAAGLSLATPELAWAAGKTQTANVGSYLPAAGDGFVQFKPNETQTPAIRAGVIKAGNSYQFVLPQSWTEQKIANILSGNFCMPRCDEPWQEVVFADPAEGQAVLYVMNLRRLTPKAGASIDKIGAPAGLLESLGPFITGTYLEEDDLLSADKVDRNGRPYYVYEANSLSGKGGPHYVAVATAKDDLLYLFTLSASEPQWKKAKGSLKKVADSFVV